VATNGTATNFDNGEIARLDPLLLNWKPVAYGTLP
jgi:hypothetical protein